MMPNPIRSLITLAEEVIEAALFLFDFGPTADDLYERACADRLAEKEAEEEVSEPTLCGRKIISTDIEFPPGVEGYIFDSRAFESSSSTQVAGAGPGDDEPPSGSVSPRDVEPEGIQSLDPAHLYTAAWCTREAAARASKEFSGWNPDYLTEVADALHAAYEATYEK